MLDIPTKRCPSMHDLIGRHCLALYTQKLTIIFCIESQTKHKNQIKLYKFSMQILMIQFSLVHFHLQIRTTTKRKPLSFVLHVQCDRNQDETRKKKVNVPKRRNRNSISQFARGKNKNKFANGKFVNAMEMTATEEKCLH